MMKEGRLFLLWGIILILQLAINLQGCGDASDDRTVKLPGADYDSSDTLVEENIIKSMIRIPKGSFRMGSDDTSWEHDEDEGPVHEVRLDEFYIDVDEVTNAEYRQFLLANPDWRKGSVSSLSADVKYLDNWNGMFFPEGADNQPVTYVSWYAARAYADWQGKHLPTEAQWEMAARGGLAGMLFPNGDELDTTMANYNESTANNIVNVGSYPANGYGLYDMAGNVWEWCSDWYENTYYSSSPYRNPDGPLLRSDKVLRGGAWNNEKFHLRVADRYHASPSGVFANVGFRCVYNPEDEDDE